MNEIEYQNKFVKLVIDNKLVNSEDLISHMIPIGKLSNQRVLEVYSNDYKFRMLDAMKANFESLWMVLGDELFEELALEFIFSSSENTLDLNQFGEKFPEFILGKKDLLEQCQVLVDLALFEISFWKVFHSQNINQKESIDFTQDQVMNSTLVKSDSLCLLRLSNDVFELFKFKDKTFEEFLETGRVDMLNHETFYILYKENFKVLCRKIKLPEFKFFEKIIVDGDALGAALEESIETVEDATSIFAFVGESMMKHLSIFNKSE
jgi:hypothetical protein